MKVCDNPACEYNAIEVLANPCSTEIEVWISPALQLTPWSPVKHPGKVGYKRVSRHMYYNPQSNETFYLCGCCHSARQM